MEFNEVINKRRSSREFSSRSIPKELIEEILEAARLAPSAANRQPWEFVILQNEMKNKVADIMDGEVTDQQLLDISVATKPYTPVNSLINSIRIIKEAPVLILVFRKPNDDWLCGDYLSIGCAVEHIHLKATDLGLGSIWIRDVIYTSDKIADAVEKKETELVVGIAVGYSTEPLYKASRKSLDSITSWYE